jgi:hypothetical protein
MKTCARRHRSNEGVSRRITLVWIGGSHLISCFKVSDSPLTSCKQEVGYDNLQDTIHDGDSQQKARFNDIHRHF